MPKIATTELVRSLLESRAYPHIGNASIKMHETHISWVFLVGDFAYKIKKPVTTEFLDYGSLEKRRHYCLEELRLDARYAKELYLSVVPITLVDNKPCMEGTGEAIEYAVKMRRFPDGALLSQRLESGTLTTEEVQQLAATIAHFHHNAVRLGDNGPWGCPDTVFSNALANFHDLEPVVTGDTLATLRVLKTWTNKYFSRHQHQFIRRVTDGFIRECHGDLHLANIVCWQNKLMPFDGIEFSDEFRWIDVMSDTAFTAMDFAARGHLELCRSFISAYLDHTGDHSSLALLRWYLVYRAMVRAKVAAIRSAQPAITDAESQSEKGSDPLRQGKRNNECDLPPKGQTPFRIGSERQSAMDDCKAHIDLACRFSLPEERCLWITHGLSGSGKTTLSESIVQRQGAIRLRSDVERKRQFGMSMNDRPSEEAKQKLYSPLASSATYDQLCHLAAGILRAGYSAVVDAAFLERRQRQMFQQLAKSEGVKFAILDCNADENTLRQRLEDRKARNNDASDADIKVLESQLASHEPLSESEAAYILQP